MKNSPYFVFFMAIMNKTKSKKVYFAIKLKKNTKKLKKVCTNKLLFLPLHRQNKRTTHRRRFPGTIKSTKDMKSWFEMTEAEQQAFAMATLNEVMTKEERAEKRRAAKAKKMQEAAKDFCNINTIDKMEFNTIVTYNLF